MTGEFPTSAEKLMWSERLKRRRSVKVWHVTPTKDGGLRYLQEGVDCAGEIWHRWRVPGVRKKTQWAYKATGEFEELES